jgi:hypothetical protein
MEFGRNMLGDWILPAEYEFDHGKDPDHYEPYRGKLVLVTGSRELESMDIVDSALSAIRPSFLIHGDATGADSLVQSWGWQHKTHVAAVPALWAHYGDPAGPIRNSEMLKLRPELLVAFPGGSGTKDMVSKAKARGVPVLYVPKLGAAGAAGTGEGALS